MPENPQNGQPVGRPCLCYIIGKHDVCPVHGLDRAQTTERDKKSERVVNTTQSLRNSK